MTPRDPRAVELISQVVRFSEFRARLSAFAQPIPKGVYFFKSLEEADAHREAWLTIAMARIGS